MLNLDARRSPFLYFSMQFEEKMRTDLLLIVHINLTSLSPHFHLTDSFKCWVNLQIPFGNILQFILEI